MFNSLPRIVLYFARVILCESHYGTGQSELKKAVIVIVFGEMWDVCD